MMKSFAIIICSLVFLVQYAFAECTWVLWRGGLVITQASFSGQPNLENLLSKAWVFMDAFSNKDECQASKTKAIDDFITAQKSNQNKAESPEKISATDDKVTIIKEMESLSSYEFKCIPDTIDPRFKG